MERQFAIIVLLLTLAQPAWGQERERVPDAQSRQSHREFQRHVDEGVEAGRRDLRAQQNVTTPAEQREGERRMDTVRERARTDPHAAQDMQRILDLDRSLSTINRPIPGGPPP